MSCRNCGSNRIAFLQAHSKDLSILQVDHLSRERDGYFPDIPGVCSGDDADFEFCLECGMIQSDTFPITDETIQAAFAEDDDDWEDDNEDAVEDLHTAYRLNDNSMDKCVYRNLADFLQIPWVEAIRAKQGFYKWALTIDPRGGKMLIASFYSDDEEDIVFEKVALVPDNFYRYKTIEWGLVENYLKG